MVTILYLRYITRVWYYYNECAVCHTRECITSLRGSGLTSNSSRVEKIRYYSYGNNRTQHGFVRYDHYWYMGNIISTVYLMKIAPQHNCSYSCVMFIRVSRRNHTTNPDFVRDVFIGDEQFSSRSGIGRNNFSFCKNVRYWCLRRRRAYLIKMFSWKRFGESDVCGRRTTVVIILLNRRRALLYVFRVRRLQQLSSCLIAYLPV